MKSLIRIPQIIEKIRTEEFKEKIKAVSGAFSRKSKLLLIDMCFLIIFRKGLTIPMEVNEYFLKYKIEEPASKQAFSKRRELIKPEAFIELNNDYVNLIYKERELNKLGKYCVYAVDGTTAEIPNTSLLQKIFGVAKGQKGQLEVARCRISGLYDCLNEIMVNVKVNPYESSERDLAKANIEEAINNILNFKPIIIFDRGYPSIDLIYFLQKNKIKYVIRLQDSIYLKEINAMKSNDEEVNLEITPLRLVGKIDKETKKILKEKGYIKTRIIKHTLENGNTEILTTNLEEEFITGKELGKLYFKRWNIEKAYDVLKNKLYIENISGKSERAVLQDLYGSILAFNMIEDVAHDVNKEVKRTKENGNKYDYKVNMNTLIGAIKLCLIYIMLSLDKSEADILEKKMMKMIKRELVAIKPNRSNHRKFYIGQNKHRSNLRRNS